MWKLGNGCWDGKTLPTGFCFLFWQDSLLSNIPACYQWNSLFPHSSISSVTKVGSQRARPVTVTAALEGLHILKQSSSLAASWLSDSFMNSHLWQTLTRLLRTLNLETQLSFVDETRMNQHMWYRIPSMKSGRFWITPFKKWDQDANMWSPREDGG